jgi:hypothetical protein
MCECMFALLVLMSYEIAVLLATLLFIIEVLSLDMSSRRRYGYKNTPPPPQ